MGRQASSLFARGRCIFSAILLQALIVLIVLITGTVEAADGKVGINDIIIGVNNVSAKPDLYLSFFERCKQFTRKTVGYYGYGKPQVIVNSRSKQGVWEKALPIRFIEMYWSSFTENPQTTSYSSCWNSPCVGDLKYYVNAAVGIVKR